MASALAQGVSTASAGHYARILEVWEQCGFSPQEHLTETNGIISDVTALLAGKVAAYERLRGIYLEEIQALTVRITEKAQLLAEQPDFAQGLPFAKRVYRLREVLATMDKRASERSALLQELHQQLHTIWRDIEYPVERHGEFAILGKELTEPRIGAYREKIASATAERTRVQTSIGSLATEIRALWDELLVPVESCTSKLDQWILGRNQDVKRTYPTLDALERKQKALIADRDKRKSDMALFLQKIKTLWTDLSIPDEEQQAFLRSISNSPKDYPLLNKEYSRLQRILQAKLHQIIMTRKERIRALCAELHFGAPEMAELAPLLDSEEYTEEAATRLGDEIHRLEALLSKMQPILKMILRREWFKKEMKAFEAAASDPNRLFRDSRQLLREENFRKLVSREFPKLTEDLKDVLTKWEEEGGKPLCFDGEAYLLTMGREQENPNFGLLHLKLLTSPHKNREERKPLSSNNGARTPSSAAVAKSANVRAALRASPSASPAPSPQPRTLLVSPAPPAPRSRLLSPSKPAAAKGTPARGAKK